MSSIIEWVKPPAIWLVPASGSPCVPEACGSRSGASACTVASSNSLSLFNMPQFPLRAASVANRLCFWQIAAFCTSKGCIAAAACERIRNSAFPESAGKAVHGTRQWMAERQMRAQETPVGAGGGVRANVRGALHDLTTARPAGQGRAAHLLRGAVRARRASPAWSPAGPGRQLPGDEQRRARRAPQHARHLRRGRVRGPGRGSVQGQAARHAAARRRALRDGRPTSLYLRAFRRAARR